MSNFELTDDDIRRLYWNSVYLPSIKYADLYGNIYYVKKIHKSEILPKINSDKVLYMLGIEISLPIEITKFLVLGYITKKTQSISNTGSIFEMATMVESFKQLNMDMEIWIYKPYDERIEIILPPEIILNSIDGEDLNDDVSFDSRRIDD